MTADHAGQTGGEREHGHRWVQVTQMQDRRERLICAEPTCRARAWGQPLPVAEQAALHEWECPSCGATTRAQMADHPIGQPDARGRVGCDCGAGLSSCAPGCACDSCDRMRGRAGQTAREAAVEAVARWLADSLTQDGQKWRSWHEQARELLSLPAVAALSAAPGQKQP